MVFSGSTSSTVDSTASSNATDIISFTISNKSGVAATVSVGIFYGSSLTYILYNEPLAAQGTATCNYVYSGDKIRVLPDYRIFVSVNASCDFYFTIQ